MANKKPKDSDLDGFPDSTDPQPYIFNYQSSTNSKLPVLSEDIAPITIPWLKDANGNYQPIPGGATAAKKALPALRVNDPAKYNQLKQQLEYSLGRKLTDKEVNAIWSDAVDWTQSPGTNNGDPVQYFTKLTPGMYAAGDGQYGTTKQTQKYTTQFTPSQASSDLNKVYRSELGREATQAEIDSYLKGVNKAAQKEPSVTTGVTTTAPGATSTTATQTTGFDPTQFAQNFARSMPDYAESFAVRSFMKLIDQSMTDPNRIGEVVQ